MAKIILTKDNIPYDNSYTNVFNFNDEASRDLYITQYLNDNVDFKQQLEDALDTSMNIDSGLVMNVIYTSTDSISNHNYAIVKDKNDSYLFYHINNIVHKSTRLMEDEVSTLSTFTLTLELDVFMTYPTYLSKIENFQMIKGHSDSDNYLENDYGNNYKIPESIERINKVAKNEVYDSLSGISWLYVYEKVTAGSAGDKINKLDNKGTWNDSFKVYIAPTTPIQVNPNASDTDINLWVGDQKSTVGFEISEVSDTNAFEFVLNQPVTKEMQFHYDYSGDSTGGGFNDYGKITTLLVSDLPQNVGDRKLFYLNGFDSNNAEAYNREIFDTGQTSLEQLNANLSVGDNCYVYYIPVIIQKATDTIYDLQNPTIQEIINVTPNAWYSDASVKKYYRDEPDKNRFGLITYNNPYYEMFSIVDFGGKLWNAQPLINYFNDTTKNANVITAKVNNFNPILTLQDTGNLNVANIKNIQFDQPNDIYFINYVNYDFAKSLNTYSITVPNTSKLEYLKGINEYEIRIENEKIFDLDYNYVSNNTFTFNHYYSITPESENRIEIESDKFISFTDDNTAWSDGTSFVKSTDNFQTYKAENPITSNAAFAYAGNIVQNPLTLLNPTTAAVSIFGGSLGTLANRQNMKRQPQSFEGTGDALGNLIFNKIGKKFGLVKYKYIGQSRPFILEDIKRYGITYNLGMYVFKYDNIKRPYWNYVMTDDLNKAQINLRLNKNINDKFNQIFRFGTTIWNDYNNFMNYSLDNGD